jgi:hypothetical protein
MGGILGKVGQSIKRGKLGKLSSASHENWGKLGMAG